MNVYEYCKENGLDISKLSVNSMEALGGSYLSNSNPTQENIDRLAMIDAGKITVEESIQETLNKYRQPKTS